MDALLSQRISMAASMYLLLKIQGQVWNLDHSEVYIMVTVAVDEAPAVLVKLYPHCVIGPGKTE